jgi:hypothetical protein
MRRLFLFQFLVLAFVLQPVVVSMAGAGNYTGSNPVFRDLQTSFPGIRAYEEEGRITRVYGTKFGTGSDPEATAAEFKEDYSDLFGVPSEDLRPVSFLADARHTQPLMYDRATGEYKFTLIYYSQFRGNIPVFRSDLLLLVRNKPNYPLVQASSALRDLGDFEVPVGVAADPAVARYAAESFMPGLSNISDPRLVIWAGVNDMQVAPAVAMEITADNGRYATPGYEKWLLLVDVQTGEILYDEDMIINTDVAGNVSGMATRGNAADICDEEEAMPLPYVRVYISGGEEAYADANGDFVISNDGDDPVTVVSDIRGDWFRVYNQQGGDSQLSLEVTPPGPADFMHNEENTSEYYRAEVNGYIQANVVRNFALRYNPTYPIIYNQHNFSVNVNIGDNCNAFYDGYSINFYTSGGGCPNTAFSTVIHHEYGHHLVNVAGSGQGQYGEGMGDVMGVLITDNSGLAYGFTGNCNVPLRNADNNHQYPCNGEIHDCGQLLSGCVWDTRNELAITNPDDYIDIIANLAVNAMLLHRGDMITPEITIDYLTLDDDDEDIWNGTPHGMEIVTGFVFEHSMDPGISLSIEHEPLVDTEDSTAVLGVSADVFSFFSMENGSVTTYYSFGDDFMELEMTNTSGDTWYGEIPNPPYETMVSYYIEAVDGAGLVATAPENAPDSVYRFYVGVDVIPPSMELVESPPNTVNLLGPYGPFIIAASDPNGIDQSEVVMHYRVNDETEEEAALDPTGNESEFGLDLIDLDRQLNTGDIVHFYFTAFDEANTPNEGRLPEEGSFELLMAESELFEDFEQFGIDRWSLEGLWEWSDDYSHSPDHSLIYKPDSPVEGDIFANMEFGYDLSPYSQARVSLYHKNAVLGDDTCFVMASGNGGEDWTRVATITGIQGPSFVYDEFDISSVLSPDDHDYRIGFRMVTEGSSPTFLFIDDIGWAVGPTTGVEDTPAGLPRSLSLSQNYPNPFNPQTNLSFALPQSSHVTLDVYDLLGRRVIRLVDGEMKAGDYVVTWDGKDSEGGEVSSGIYFYRLSTDYAVRQEKMTLLR